MFTTLSKLTTTKTLNILKPLLFLFPFLILGFEYWKVPFYFQYALVAVAFAIFFAQKSEKLRSLKFLTLGFLLFLIFALEADKIPRIYPLVMSFFGLAFFVASWFQEESVLEFFAKRFGELSDLKRKKLRGNMLLWVVGLSLNTALIAILTVGGSTKAWALYTGLYSYFLLGGLFLITFLTSGGVERLSKIPLRIAYIAKHVVIFGLFGLMAISFLPFIPLIKLASWGDKKRYTRYMQYFIRHAFQFVQTYTRILRFVDMRDFDHGGEKVGQLFIANHISMMDVIAIICYIPNCFTFINAKFANNPIIGFTALGGGYIPIDFDDPTSMLEGYLRVREHLLAGEKVIIFPEGTRCTDGRLGEMHQGAFKLSIDTKIPITPIFITSDHAILNKKNNFQLSCVQHNSHFFPPIPLPNEASDKANLAKLALQLQKFYDEKSSSELALDYNKARLHLPSLEKVELSNMSGKAQLMVNNDCLFLDGHFDEFSIMPGVSQIEFVLKLVAAVLGQQTVSLVKATRCKFLDKITPDTLLEIFVDVQKESNTANYTITSQLKTYAKGELEFAL